MATEISVIFSTEEKTLETDKLYYPYTPGVDGKKVVNAGGVLYDKYLALRKKLIKSNIIDKKDRLPEGT